MLDNVCTLRIGLSGIKGGGLVWVGWVGRRKGMGGCRKCVLN